MRKPIKKLSMFQIIFFSLKAALFHNNNSISGVPVKIGPYTLIKPLTKVGTIANFQIGIYEKNGKKFFGKTWNKKSKDLSYYTLLNEFRVCEILRQKLDDLQSEVRVPKPVFLYQQDNSLSVLFEYIGYKDISTLPVEKQADIYQRALIELERASKHLSESEKTVFTKRTMLFYLLSLPFHIMLAAVKNPTLIRPLLRACRKLFRLVRIKNDLVLSHRDLRGPNIKIGNNKIYLLDSEDMTLTVNGFDVADVNILLRNQSKKKQVSVTLPGSNYAFFMQYIAIQRSSNLLHDDRYKNYLRQK